MDEGLLNRAKPEPPAGAAPLAAPLLTLGGLAAAFGAASCCGLPFLLASAGLGTAWLGGIALIADPVKPWLLGFAALALAGGAALLARQQWVRVCRPGAACARPATRALTLAGLLAGAALLYVGYRYV